MAQQPGETMFGHSMLKRTFIALAILALLVGVFAIASMLRVQTASAVDLSEKNCSIQVSMPSETQELLGGPAEVVYDLYLVATAKEIPGVDGYDFVPVVAALKEGSADWSEIGSPEFYDALAQLACTFTPLNPDLPKDQQWRPVDSKEAGATVTDIDAGLYLVIAHSPNMDAAQYTNITDGVYTTIATSPNYEFTFKPELVAVPSKISSTGAFSTMGPGSWTTDEATGQYIARATLKPTQGPRYGSLQILKDLLSYESAHPAEFAFQVEAYSDAARTQSVYSNVFRVQFDAAGQKSLLIEGRIPAGSYVTVTEVYSGASYSIVGDATVDVERPIVADPIGGLNGNLASVATVSFTNQYDDRTNQGGSIVNNFRYATPDERAAQGITDLQWIWTRE